MKAMKIVLGALVVLMALGGIAMAQTTVSTTIDVTKVLDAPTSASIANLHVGDNSQVLDGVKVHTNTNTWTLSAATTLGYNGKFWANGGTGPQLQDQYSLNVPRSPGYYYGSGYPPTEGPVKITDVSAMSLADGANPGDFAIPITFNQNVKGTDPVGAVQTVIVFTLV